MGYELFISWRYLKARRKQIFISVISLISITGVALGVAALVVTLSVMNGFRKDLREKIIGMSSHVVVLDQRNMGLEEPKITQEKIKKIESVVAVAPFVYGQAILRNGDRTSGAVVKGIYPEETKKVASLLTNLKEGKLDYLEFPLKKRDSSQDKILPGNPTGDEKGIVMGAELAKNLNLSLGMNVLLISPMDVATELGMIPRMEKFRLVGIFDSGMYEYDASLAYIFFPVAQKLFNLGERATGLEVKIDNIFSADKVTALIQKELGYPYWARSWMVTHRNLFAALKLEKVTMFIILVLIVLVAAFNIISTLMMMTMEKTKDIGILKAMGAARSGVLKIFLFEGLIIGLLGTVIGTGVGYIACRLLDKYQFIKLPQDVYYISSLPVHMQGTDFIYIISVVLLTSLIATIYPAYKASRLDPCEAIRYE
jgi:lipoprotein-releasing system permease protein